MSAGWLQVSRESRRETPDTGGSTAGYWLLGTNWGGPWAQGGVPWAPLGPRVGALGPNARLWRALRSSIYIYIYSVVVVRRPSSVVVVRRRRSSSSSFVVGRRQCRRVVVGRRRHISPNAFLEEETTLKFHCGGPKVFPSPGKAFGIPLSPCRLLTHVF